MGPQWVKKRKTKCGRLLLCVIFGQFGRRGTVERSIMRSILYKGLNFHFFIILGVVQIVYSSWPFFYGRFCGLDVGSVEGCSFLLSLFVFWWHFQVLIVYSLCTLRRFLVLLSFNILFSLSIKKNIQLSCRTLSFLSVETVFGKFFLQMEMELLFKFIGSIYLYSLCLIAPCLFVS